MIADGVSGTYNLYALLFILMLAFVIMFMVKYNIINDYNCETPVCYVDSCV